MAKENRNITKLVITTEELVYGSWTNAPRCPCRIEIDSDAKMHVYHDSSCRFSVQVELR